MEKTENQKYDLFYLKENGKLNVKESFKFVMSRAADQISRIDRPVIADVGCAVGDLLAYIQSLYPKAELHGLDVQPELLEKARKELPSVQFHLFDILKGDNSQGKKFDFVFMCGVHGAFEDPRQWLPNFLKLLKDDGVAFIYGLFNPDPIDIIAKVRPSGSTGDYISNWNLPSLETMSLLLDKAGYAVESSYFQIAIDIPKRDGDPLRSWTFKYEDGSRGTVNGSQLLHHNYLLKVHKK
jgi:SAM-dependent methyltransferase